MTETTENNDSDKVQMNVEQTRKLRRSGSSSTLIISVDKGIKETYGLEPGQMVTIMFKTLYKGRPIAKQLLNKPVQEIEQEMEEEETKKETLRYQTEVMKDIVKEQRKPSFL